MAEYTEEYWDVNGISLNNFAWGIEVASEGIPPRRGDNWVVPYRHGEIWRPKVYDARDLALAMWVTSGDLDGVEAATEQGQRASLRENIEALKALFAPIDRQLTITRRIRLPWGLVSRYCLAECIGTLDFVPDSVPDAVRFAVELHLADPFWYDLADTTVTVPFAGTTLNNPGTAAARHMTITLNGPLTNPRLMSTGGGKQIWVSYQGTIASGDYVVLDTHEFTAIHKNGSNQIAAILHSGANYWMELSPGNNGMSFPVGSGTGNAVITFKAPYL